MNKSIKEHIIRTILYMNKNNDLKRWELTNFCEIDKYASEVYMAVHNVSEELNLGDVTLNDMSKVKDFTFISAGSPCQDFSLAGKQAGSVWTCDDCGFEYNPITVHHSKRNKCPHCDSENISKTRSSLLVEFLKFVREKNPKFGIYENVKNLTSKKFIDTFNMFLGELNEYGYNTYYKVLNAKNYGIPQNRERVYVVYIRKDLDNGMFKFPVGFELKLRLKDMLENEVDEKYYLSDELIEKITANSQSQASDNEPCINIKEATKKGYKEAHDGDGVYINRPHQKRGVVQENMIQTIKTGMDIGVVVGGSKNNLVGSSYIRYYGSRGKLQNENGIADTLLRAMGTGGGNMPIVNTNLRIRKLTPLECWRLMGFKDNHFIKAKDALNEKFYKGKDRSSSQLYKQAGNSIVVDVLFYIYKNIYSVMPYLFDDLKMCSLFSGIGAPEVALDRLYDEVINIE